MPSDNVTLNAGSGGSTVRTFADSSGSEWPSAVACFATAVSPGANVLEPVTPTAPLPVTGADQVASLYSGATPVTPQYAPISASASGVTTIVAAVAGKRIIVLRWSLSASGNVNVNLQSHTTTATATGLHYLTQYGSAGGAYCPAGIFATASGEALDINLSAAVAVGGELTYVVA